MDSKASFYLFWLNTAYIQLIAILTRGSTLTFGNSKGGASYESCACTIVGFSFYTRDGDSNCFVHLYADKQ
jgi:hypothetical protein